MIEITEDTVILHYQDDGPDGPCGQITSVTSPWDKLYIFDSMRDAKMFNDQVEAKLIRRKKPRIIRAFYEEDIRRWYPMKKEDGEGE